MFPQTALVSFATTGEKTVAAVLTCRNEVVSVRKVRQPGGSRCCGQKWAWGPGQAGGCGESGSRLEAFLMPTFSLGMRSSSASLTFIWYC